MPTSYRTVPLISLDRNQVKTRFGAANCGRNKTYNIFTSLDNSVLDEMHMIHP
jgi:hypothetical protein